MLLAPVADRLGSKRLLVVGEGVLQMLPFAALPVPGEHSSGRLLIHDHEIVQLPSASVLAAMREQRGRRTPAPEQLAVFADPVTSGMDPRLPVRSIQAPLHFARLSHAGREARAIEAMVPPDRLLSFHGFSATREAAVEPLLRQYRMVHFATHGLLHSRHPELSGLVLSLFDETGQARNGFIRAHEIAHLDLPAELVVLSACETAKGVAIQGEGVVNLTRACMQAGAARVVVSLWNVNDRATAELMERFYRAMLVDDLPPLAALRSAQLSMLEHPRLSRLRAPFYWAGFVFQGEWRRMPARL
jgi:CHAT domain-containing protein